jgi:hypothetical protein
MCMIDLEPATIWEETYRTARTEKQCSSCGMLIQPGDPYMYLSYLCDGRWTHEIGCAPCIIVRDDFADAHGQSFGPSLLLEMLNECVDRWSRDKDQEWRHHLAFLLNRIRRAKRIAKCSRT